VIVWKTLKNNKRQRVVGFITQADMHGAYIEFLGICLGKAIELQVGFAKVIVEHLDISPLNAVTQPGTKRFDKRLLGGKALGQVAGWLSMAGQHPLLLRAEYTLGKALAVACHGLLKAPHTGNIRTYANNH